jgi:hypothetical protein
MNFFKSTLTILSVCFVSGTAFAADPRDSQSFVWIPAHTKLVMKSDVLIPASFDPRPFTGVVLYGDLESGFTCRLRAPVSTQNRILRSGQVLDVANVKVMEMDDDGMAAVQLDITKDISITCIGNGKKSEKLDFIGTLKEKMKDVFSVEMPEIENLLPTPQG